MEKVGGKKALGLLEDLMTTGLTLGFGTGYLDMMSSKKQKKRKEARKLCWMSLAFR